MYQNNQYLNVIEEENNTKEVLNTYPHYRLISLRLKKFQEQLVITKTTLLTLKWEMAQLLEKMENEQDEKSFKEFQEKTQLLSKLEQKKAELEDQKETLCNDVSSCFQAVEQKRRELKKAAKKRSFSEKRTLELVS